MQTNAHAVDIFEILSAEQHGVEESLDTMDDCANDSQVRQWVFRRLRERLEKHIDRCGSVLYTELKRKEKCRAVASEAEEEHRGILSLLVELSTLNGLDEQQWEAKCAELRTRVEHAMSLERIRVFRVLRETLTRQELRELANRYSKQPDSKGK